MNKLIKDIQGIVKGNETFYGKVISISNGIAEIATKEGLKSYSTIEGLKVYDNVLIKNNRIFKTTGAKTFYV